MAINKLLGDVGLRELWNLIKGKESVINARMDTFTHLEDGSTTGDAELADIRVGSDGTEYTSAGSAVRGQVSYLKSAFELLADDQIALYYSAASLSGTGGITVNVSIPAGSYTMTIGNLTSSDTQYSNCRIFFYTDNGSTFLFSKDVPRSASTTQLTFGSNCDVIKFYAAHNYADSAGVSFAYTDILITRDTGLNARLTAIENEIGNTTMGTTATTITGAIAEHEGMLVGIEETTVYSAASLSGTRGIAVDVSIPAGSYTMTIGNLTSSDTQYSNCRIFFYTDNGSTFLFSKDVPRSASITELTFASAVDRITFYGAHTYADSAGVSFAYTDVTIKALGSPGLIERVTTLENAVLVETKVNPYQDVVFGDDVTVKTTTHAHCRNQMVLDNLTGKNLDAVALSNYYPSSPTYTLAESGYFTNIPDVVEIPNAEQHGFTNTVGACHMNSIGSLFSSGSPLNQTPVGVSDTWQHAVTKIKRQFLLENGGGITVNHPVWSQLSTSNVCEFLDYDESIIGIEIYNQTCEELNNKGYALTMWDEILTSGRKCWGFAVPDHYQENQDDGANWLGSITMFVPVATQENCLKAIRNGAFYSQLAHTTLALTDFVVTGKTVSITVSESATIKAIVDGDSYNTVTGTTATITVPDNATYVRFEVSTANDTIFTNPVLFRVR